MKTVTIKSGKIEVTDISRILESKKEFIGGPLTYVSVTPNIDMWLNDEGKLQGLEQNMILLLHSRPFDIVCGNVFFASHNEEGETIGLNDSQIETLMSRLRIAKMIDGRMLIALELQ